VPVTRSALAYALVIALLAALGTLGRPALGQELLSNGGFEQGLTSWIHDGASTSGCSARSGATAVALVNDAAETLAFVHQTISGPFGGGPWVLTGWIRANSAPVVTIQLIWLAGGIPLERVTHDLTPGPDYARFSLLATAPEDNAQALRVLVRLSDSPGAVVCLDDLSVEEGPLPTVTPTQSATPTAEPSPMSTAAPSATAPASATPGASATPASTTGPSPTFINGGFEDGLSGWSKFGGELLHVANPRRSGSGAGHLLSDTDSTKWAFQTVIVDTDHYYELAGYLQTDAGAGGAYLRISWYASSDGTGSALDTTDSTSAIGGGSSGFQFLTTGAVKPPAGAQSARLRAVLTPSGPGAASLFLDDFSFAQVPPPPPAATATATAMLTVTAAPTTTSTAAPTQPAGSTTVPSQTPIAPGATGTTETPGGDDEPRATGAGTARTPTVTSRDQSAPEASSTDTVPTPRPRAPGQPQALSDPDEDEGGGGVPVLWILGFALFVAGAGGAYLRARTRP
jgi:hypothetical protein